MAQSRSASRRQALVLVVALIILGVWWAQGGSPDSERTSGERHSSQTTKSARTGAPASTDPVSGLPIVAVGDLPPEAAQILAVIDRGGPYAEDEDGGTFQNREEILPDRPMGYYQEFTVPTPGSDDRGARRIVSGEGGEFYWTDDHYSSFSRIRR